PPRADPPQGGRRPAPSGAAAPPRGLPPAAIEREGETPRFRYTARDVAPLQTQPHSPIENETMPWVQIGAGARQRDLIRSIADWALMRARPGTATLDLAKRSAGGNSARPAPEG